MFFSNATLIVHNVHCSLRAPKGDGTEALALSAVVDRRQLVPKNAKLAVDGAHVVSSAGIAVALMQRLQTAPWLAKDVMLLLVDGGAASAAHSIGVDTLLSRQGRVASVAQFQCGIHVALDGEHGRGGLVNGFDRIDSSLVCANGAMPNLDLFNVAHRVSYYDGMREFGLGEFDVVESVVSRAKLAEHNIDIGQKHRQVVVAYTLIVGCNCCFH
jgi:hypothetical protein